MLHSLRLRLMLALLVVILVALAVVAIFSSRATSNEFQRYIDTESTQRGRAMAELLVHYRQNRNWRNVEPLLEQLSMVFGDRIILADARGRVIADSEGTLGDDMAKRIQRILLEDAEYPAFGPPTVLIDTPDGPQVYVYISSTGAVESNSATLFLGSVNRQLLLAILVAGVVGLALTTMFSRQILKPVEALTAAARKMEKGDLNQRVEVESRDEIGELAHAFNAMAGGLQHQEELRSNMVSDIAHELRTPLSNVRGYLEAVRDGVIDPSPILIDSLHEETMVLTRLLDDLQDLAQSEAGNLTLQCRPIKVQELIETAVARAQPEALEKNLHIKTLLTDRLPLVAVDTKRIGQVLRNLLSNAIAYSAQGDDIEIGARQQGREVEISVRDTGTGIAPDYLPYIFDRFYRSDESRTRATGGTGLGLAIAKRWVEEHGGAIRAESSLGRGTTITFTVPVAEYEWKS